MCIYIYTYYVYIISIVMIIRLVECDDTSVASMAGLETCPWHLRCRGRGVAPFSTAGR